MTSSSAEPDPASAPHTGEEKAAIWIHGQTPLGGTIALADYDPAWPAHYESHRQRIAAALGNRIVMLEHVGSTSVPGLAAKPRIDILLVVADSADEPSYVPLLETAGYALHIRERDWHEHRLLRGSEPDANVHVFSPGCTEIERMLGFRDWLRSHEDDRRLYESNKRSLAAQQWAYVQDYADAKTAVVEDIQRRAGLPAPLDS
jgi:GrpB-like predicted nucleotidyltransferase (UPF0157 family)